MRSPRNPPSLLQADALKDAARTLAADVRTKMEGPQQGVGTFGDHALIDLIGQLAQLDEAVPWEESVSQLSGSIEGLRLALERLQLFLTRRGQGRFVDFEVRGQAAPGPFGRCDLSDLDVIASQGVFDCMQWKGMPLFKTAYDFSIYTMLLWALKPRTIIELGSGSGASAIWLADLMTTFGIRSTVYSVDVKKPEVEHDKIRFIQGDCRTIDTVFEEDVLKSAPHPWMLIEDAHVNVHGVLSHFHSYVAQGDYVVVEDSAGKQADISTFLAQRPGCYKVDTYYTDFFGRNVTCAQDSIFVRT